MIIGNPSRFAIEFELKPQYGGVWMWGHLRYWCGGTEVGDFRIDTSLRDALFELDASCRSLPVPIRAAGRGAAWASRRGAVGTTQDRAVCRCLRPVAPVPRGVGPLGEDCLCAPPVY